jgi:arsenate reductase (glutaredoxin)
MPLRIYAYKNCDTCRRALKWVAARGVAHEVVPIREKPPTVAELKSMLERVGELRRLFNTSGQDYKAMNMKERLPKMSEKEALALLAENGNLVKRPFAISANAGAVGFDKKEWTELFAS